MCSTRVSRRAVVAMGGASHLQETAFADGRRVAEMEFWGYRRECAFLFFYPVYYLRRSFSLPPSRSSTQTWGHIA